MVIGNEKRGGKICVLGASRTGERTGDKMVGREIYVQSEAGNTECVFENTKRRGLRVKETCEGQSELQVPLDGSRV